MKSAITIEQGLRRRARVVRRRLHELLGSDRYSRTAQFDLESKLMRYIPYRDGVFIEAGANDGLTQSNTYWLERFRGWKGILIEPNPVLAAECHRNRPRAKLVNAALVADTATTSITIATAGLRGFVVGSFTDSKQEAYQRKVAAEQENLEVRDIIVPARTLEDIIDESGYGRVDFFSLDVEGYEPQVLTGMNVERHRPRYIMVEGLGPDAILPVLRGHYEFVEMITPQDYLLRAKD